MEVAAPGSNPVLTSDFPQPRNAVPLEDRILGRSRAAVPTRPDFFASHHRTRSFGRVTKPLAVVFYERLLPGSRIANRLADLGWRVSEAKSPADIVPLVRSERPLVVIAEVAQQSQLVCGAVAALKDTPETEHVPVLGYGDPSDSIKSGAALAAGARLMVAEAGVCDQLPQLLDHVLAVE